MATLEERWLLDVFKNEFQFGDQVRDVYIDGEFYLNHTDLIEWFEEKLKEVTPESQEEE